MVEDKNSSQDTVQKSGHIVLQNVSYDKDVVEIKLSDAIVSDNYGGNFVKDVCVDEGALLHKTTSEQKPVDRRSPQNFSCQMIDADSEIRYGKKDYSRISVEELKQEAVAPHCNNEKQQSSGKECDLEDRIDTAYIAGNPSEKKISLQELLLLESAEESRHRDTINSESSEKHKRPLHEEAVGQTSKDGDPDVETILANSSEHISSGISSKENASGCSASTPADHDTATALDVREPQKIDRHNPFVDHRSLDQDTSVPECSIPGITYAASTDSICSIHNATSSTTGLDEVEALEPGAESTSSSDIQSSEKSNDNSESIFSKAIAGAVDETAVATSSIPNSAEPSNAYGKDQEKHDQIDEEHSIGTNDGASKSYSTSTLAQDGSVVEQTMPGSSKSTARVGDESTYEPNFSGPSIMSGSVSMSGHIEYSGNISLRSDSSTTSTRSFAFPVLQREWISSPVRMAKAEHRRSRRVWRKGIICCKF